MGAIPIRNLRLYAGPNDSLPHLPDGNPIAGNLAEVPIDVRDANGNGTFDDHDSLFFYGHGTSLWKRQAGAPDPIRFAFASDPYSFVNRYYLDFAGRAAGPALRWGDARVSRPQGPAQAYDYHYLRGEKDAVAVGCTPGTEPIQSEFGISSGLTERSAAEASTTTTANSFAFPATS